MNLSNFEPIVTDQDCDRLDALLAELGGSPNGLLEKELNRSVVVPQISIPNNVVTMHSIVSFVDEGSGEEMQVALVYPNNSDASKRRISVLAPLGSALLGLKAGQSIEYPLPSGRKRMIQVTSVDFQPEALGKYDL